MNVTFSRRRYVGVFMAVCDGAPSCCRHPCKMPALLLQDVTVTLTITKTINTLFLVNFLKCVITEVVLFSIVALKILDISQGRVATHLRCGGIFSDSIITNFLLILRVK